MADKTGIEWTDATWNPVRGCSRVSEGCRNCYAERLAARFSGPGMAYAGLAVIRDGEPRWTGKVRLIEKHLEDPLRWKRPRLVFVNSMSDLFHESLSDADIDRVFAVMAMAPQHVFQILTKRPLRMLMWFSKTALGGTREQVVCSATRRLEWPCWPLPNVWLGVSVENQVTADERIPLLLDTPAAVRFVSAEPLLGPVDFAALPVRVGGVVLASSLMGAPRIDSLRGYSNNGRHTMVDWVIAGGESGPGARPMHPDWPRSIRDQCVAARVAFFFKQWGEFTPDGPEARSRVGKKVAGRVLDGTTWDQMPAAAMPILCHGGLG